MRRTPWRNSGGATTNPPSPSTGSITIAATFSGATCVMSARSSASSASSTSGPAVRAAERDAVDLRCERAEARLVRMRLRRQRHRQKRAPVERALEADDALPLRVRARELDRVLDRLRSRVEERRSRLAVDGRELDQPLRELDVDLVRDDREIGVAEPRELLLRRRDDARMRVADVEAADAAGEVDEGVAVDVGERRAASLRDHDGKEDRERLRDRRAPCARGSPSSAARGSRSGGRSCESRPRGGRYRT